MEAIRPYDLKDNMEASFRKRLTINMRRVHFSHEFVAVDLPFGIGLRGVVWPMEEDIRNLVGDNIISEGLDEASWQDI